MTGDEKLRELESIGLFAGCTRRELRAIAHLCTEMQVPSGHRLTTQGTPGLECFVIAAGEAEVVIDGHTVCNVRPGACIGEMSLLDGGPRSATVTAVTPMVVYVMGLEEFRALLDLPVPLVTRRIMTALSRRLRRIEAALAA